MRVTSAVSRSARNEDEREGRLKQMWISASASNAAENENKRDGRLEQMHNSASASRAALNEEESVHPELEYRLGLPIYRLLCSAFRLSISF